MLMSHPLKTFMKPARAIGLVIAIVLSTSVQAESGSSDWEVAGQVYLWGASVGGTSAAGDDAGLH